MSLQKVLECPQFKPSLTQNIPYTNSILDVSSHLTPIHSHHTLTPTPVLLFLSPRLLLSTLPRLPPPQALPWQLHAQLWISPDIFLQLSLPSSLLSKLEAVYTLSYFIKIHVFERFGVFFKIFF